MKKESVVRTASNLGQKLLDYSKSNLKNAELYKILYNKFFKYRTDILDNFECKMSKEDQSKLNEINEQLIQMFSEIEELEFKLINRILKNL